MKQAMQKQEDPLNLQSLPLVSPPSDGWPVIKAALRRDRRRRTILLHGGVILAVAASVTLALGLMLLRPVSGPAKPAPEQSWAETPSLPQGQPEALETARASTDSLEALITLSQRLEGRLRALRSGVGDLPAEAVVYQVELEDLVVQVDEELSSRPDSLALWSQRVSLLMDLDRLYENRLRREYHRVASL